MYKNNSCTAKTAEKIQGVMGENGSSAFYYYFDF